MMDTYAMFRRARILRRESWAILAAGMAMTVLSGLLSLVGAAVLVMALVWWVEHALHEKAKPESVHAVGWLVIVSCVIMAVMVTIEVGWGETLYQAAAERLKGNAAAGGRGRETALELMVVWGGLVLVGAVVCAWIGAMVLLPCHRMIPAWKETRSRLAEPGVAMAVTTGAVVICGLGLIAGKVGAGWGWTQGWSMGVKQTAFGLTGALVGLVLWAPRDEEKRKASKEAPRANARVQPSPT